MGICRYTCMRTIQNEDLWIAKHVCTLRAVEGLEDSPWDDLSRDGGNTDVPRDTKYVSTFCPNASMWFSRRVLLYLDGMIPLRTHLLDMLTHATYTLQQVKSVLCNEWNRSDFIDCEAHHLTSCRWNLFFFVSLQILLSCFFPLAFVNISILALSALSLSLSSSDGSPELAQAPSAWVNHPSRAGEVGKLVDESRWRGRKRWRKRWGAMRWNLRLSKRSSEVSSGLKRRVVCWGVHLALT